MEGKRIGVATAVLLLAIILTACAPTTTETSRVDVPPTSENNPVDEEIDVVTEEVTATSTTLSTDISPTPTEAIMQLPDLGEAPEIVNQTWLNADEPVTIASQRGKVILLEFWTFG